MNPISFDINKLTKADRAVYEAMSDYEKRTFETTWRSMEAAKLRMEQMQRASKERCRREKKVQAEKDRKARTHRLIERGAILEQYIESPEEITNDALSEVLKILLTTDTARDVIKSYRSKSTGDAQEISISQPLY